MKSEFKNCLEYMKWVSLRVKKRGTENMFEKNLSWVFGREEVAEFVSRTLTASGVRHKREKDVIEVAESALVREVVFPDEDE
jgi:hypothetical protein